MALISNSLLSDISNAINNKLGTTGTISPVDFATKISQIGGGSSPTGTIEITTNGTHNVEAYQYASVSVPTTDEAGLSWNIVNNLSDEHIQIKKSTNFVAENRVLNKTTNKYTIDSFAYNMTLTVYPGWGYRFKSGSITFSESGNTSVTVNVSTLKNYDLSLTSDIYPTALFSSNTLITDSQNISSTINITGNAETEEVTGLTTFDTTGLTKTWTGTLECGNEYYGMYSTTSDFPITDSNLGTRTGKIYQVFTFADDNHETPYYTDPGFVNDINNFNPMRTQIRSLAGNGNGFYGSYNAFYLQVGDIFIYYPASTVSTIPSDTVHILPVNCSIDYLVTYLKSNVTTIGDTLTISKWEASS